MIIQLSCNLYPHREKHFQFPGHPFVPDTNFAQANYTEQFRFGEHKRNELLI